LFLPAAGKLRALIQFETRRRIMIIDGLAAVAQGENPRVLEARLKGYLST
jgi:chemotaxis protein MotA